MTDGRDGTGVEQDLTFLLHCFRAVLEDAGDHALARQLPWPEHDADTFTELPPERLAQAYSISFQLLNIAEENFATQERREAETLHGLTQLSGGTH